MDNQKFSSDIKKYLLIATYTVLLYLILTNIKSIIGFLVDLYYLLNPVILGFAIAYVLNILLKVFEERVFAPINKYDKPLWKKLKRPASILLTYSTVIIFFTILAWFIIPQLMESLSMLTSNLHGYMASLKVFVTDLAIRFNLESDIWEKIALNWSEVVQKFGGLITDYVPYILTFTKNFTASFVDVVMGAVLSAYLLINKEKLSSISKKLLYAFVSPKRAEKTVEVCSITNRAFSGFIAGQLTEAMILGGLCFIGMTIFSMPYALLVSVIVAVTSIVPIFGAYIGTIPSAFIILMVDPPKAFWFVIFIIVLQQLEGNFIYPRVVGNSIGMNGLWVLLSLMIGGSLFGLMGMLLGIPTFAVIYTLLRIVTNNRLKKRNIKIS
ncbi:AI-2E family transporter [Paenibacillus marinisediminis]